MLNYRLTVADLVAFAAFNDQTRPDYALRVSRNRMLAAWLVGVGGYLLISLVATIPLVLGRQLVGAGVAEVAALGLGIGAALTGLNIYITSVTCLILSILFIEFGCRLTYNFLSYSTVKYAEYIASVIIMLLAIYQLFF